RYPQKAVSLGSGTIFIIACVSLVTNIAKTFISLGRRGVCGGGDMLSRGPVWSVMCVSLCSLEVSGCGMRAPPDPTQLIAVADVMNSIFCGISLASDRAHSKQVSLPRYAALTLHLKIINSTSIGISLGGGSSSGGGGGSSGGGKGSTTAKAS